MLMLRTLWTPRVVFRVVTVCAVASVYGVADVRGAQDPSFLEVMRRVHEFVVGYEDDLSTLVAEEHYEQQVLDEDGIIEQRRILASDYWVFQILPEESWFAVRDVYEVDGQSVRERTDRLPEPFRLAPGEDAFERALAIGNESARFNIGDVVRTINVPTFALAFLRPNSRERMHFVKLGEGHHVDGVSTWVIGYREVLDGGRTFITTPDGTNLLTRGRFWIDPTSGRVVQSELITGDGRIGRTARITVRYQPNAGVGLWVPVEMKEVYESTDPGRRFPLVVGTATYANHQNITPK